MNPVNGKGSKPRPIQDSDAYSKNWNKIFNDGQEVDPWPDNPLEGTGHPPVKEKKNGR